MATLVVVRVVYVNGQAASVSAPAFFDGPTAAIDASSYLKKVTTVPADTKNRTEYHILPVAHRESVCAGVRLGKFQDEPLHGLVPEEEKSGLHLKAGAVVAAKLRRVGGE